MSGERPDVIRALVQRFHFESVLDWSGSTFSAWGGDPNDVIGAVAVSMFRWLSRHGGGTAGVLPWGTTPDQGRAVGPLPVKRDLKRLKAAARARANLGGNDMPAALQATSLRLQQLPPGTTPLIWVPTDGIETVTDATYDAVNALPAAAVHLVLIDPLHGCTEAMEDDWRSVAFGSVTRIEDLSVRHVATVLAQLGVDVLGLQLATTATPRPAGPGNGRTHSNSTI